MLSNSDIPVDLSSLMDLANSPAGKKLMEFVKQKSGEQLSSAMKDAESGSFEQARELIGGILSSPEAKKLIRELEVTNE